MTTRHNKCLQITGLLLSIGLCSCNSTSSQVSKRTEPQRTAAAGKRHFGLASVYKDHRTASGEPYRASAMACAHKSYPLGSRIKVTHMGSGRSVIVRVNDRGPYIKGRIVDLTPAAASKIGLGWSIARVSVERM